MPEARQGVAALGWGFRSSGQGCTGQDPVQGARARSVGRCRDEGVQADAGLVVHGSGVEQAQGEGGFQDAAAARAVQPASRVHQRGDVVAQLAHHPVDRKGSHSGRHTRTSSVEVRVDAPMAALPGDAAPKPLGARVWSGAAG
ncbi:hypothetical protein [Streptomyces niveus]|uniref:hypothetical protein n=1 Tax=Streptomyces niveus TaxID=193462 RepID=UPI0036D20F21